jgi:NAD(P)-dependent dehydrogenase (short-subunit alcohol dehydrogenase family)
MTAAPTPAAPFDLTGRVAVVTAGTAGIGATVAQTLAGLGATVVVTSREDARARAFEAAGQGIKGRTLSFEPDVIRDGLGAIAGEFGRLDVLVNAAASRVAGRTVETTTADDLMADYRDTCVSTFLCCQAVMAMHERTGTKSIVNIGSIYGSLAVDNRIYDDPADQSPLAYATSKGALIQMTRYLAAYWAPRGVRVNCVSVGGVRGGESASLNAKYSARVPMGRMAESSEIGAAVAFLASDASSYMTGANLPVDGGLNIW